MKVFLHYQDNDDSDLHKTLKITLPKSWKNGPTSKLLGQFVESYNGNEKFGSANPLDADQMHLAIREEASAAASASESHSLVPLASDAITIETIPDRGDVHIAHGPSRTLKEIDDERKAAEEKIKAEKASTVACTHFGCNNRFPRGGPYPECRYHAAPPVFHETAKFWSCCPQKKAYDWEQFQKIPGCMTGVCTDVKEDAAGKQFLGGTDLREKMGEAQKLKSIDDFNKSQEAGGSDAAPVLDRLRTVLGEMGVEAELFDQVVEGMKKNHAGADVTDEAVLDAVATDLGKRLKDVMKEIAREQLRIK
mmetsp:Transcript_52895/g.158337  ORF Transcript_52895/g.158337 Transcript_52895/m.158337 type:complete len:307 (-) Transcript_52895:169-1089(-)